MERSGPVSLPVLLVGLLGVGAFTTISTRGSAPPAVEAQAARETPAAESVTGTESDPIAGARPALDLLADYLAVLPPGPVEGGSGGANPAPTPRGRANVDGTRALLEAVRARVRRADPQAWQADEPSAGGAGPSSGRAPAGAPRVNVMVATMPDYVNSYSAWLFDQNIDGLQRAASAAQYVLDRFYLPDWEPDARSGTAPRGERHETEPAAILFRGFGSRSNDLLLVLMPLETATAGVHKRAFLAAVALARALSPLPVRVLGPTFSGSSRSLRIAFDAAMHTGLVDPFSCAVVTDPKGAGERRRCFVVRSGSATASWNRGSLEREYCGFGPSGECVSPVDYRAATTTLDDMQAALERYLGTIDPDWQTGKRVAILSEATTGFGQSFGSTRSAGGGGSAGASGTSVTRAGEPGSTAAADTGAVSFRPPRTYFPQAVRLTYPLHISRLRSEARTAAADAAKAKPSNGPAAVALRLEDTLTATDQLPAVRPQATAAVVQTTLDTIVDTLELSRITAVGLFGTDDRDKIYLAEQLRYRAPNVLLFTIEGSLVVLHAQARSFMTGAIVAATYPLYGTTQLLEGGPADPVRPLQQFQSVSAEGVYNAFLSQLIDEEPPGPSGGLGERAAFLRARLVDYGLAGCGGEASPAAAACGPGVWVSVIGRNAVWPVQRYTLAEVRDARAPDYTWLPPPAGPVLRTAAPAEPPRGGLPRSLMSLASAALGAVPTSPASADGPPGAPTWPASASVAIGLVVAAAVLHALGALAIAWILFFERDDARPSWTVTAAQWLAARLRRHFPWLEPPDLCARRWIGRAEPHDEPRASRDAALRQEYWVSVIACGGAIVAVAFWASHLLGIGLGLRDTARPLMAVALEAFRWASGLVLLVAAAAALFPTSRRRRAGLTALSVLRLAPVALGVVTLFYLDAFLRNPVWSSVVAPFGVLRLADVRSMISPTVPVLAFALAVYLWGLWNLWRLHLHAVAFGPQTGVVAVLSGLGLETRSGEETEPPGPRPRNPEPAVVRRARLLLDSPVLAIGLGAALVLGGLMLLQAWTGVKLGTATADGAAMNGVLFCGTTLVSFLVAHTLAHGFRQGSSLLQVLDALNLAPIAPVFEKLGKRRELWQLSAGTPRAEEAHLLVQQARAAALAMTDVLEVAVPAPPPARPPSEWRPRQGGDRPVVFASGTLAMQLRVRPGDIALMRAVPADAVLPLTREDERRPLHASPAWRGIQEWSEHLVRVLWRGPWGRHSLVPLGGAAAAKHAGAAGQEPDVRRPAAAGPREAYFTAAETLLGLQVAFSMRFAVVRLMAVFGLAVSALLLLLCAHLFYTFQSRAFWLGIDWVLIGTAAATAVYFLVRLDKSAVLSHLWQSEPGKIGWGDQLFQRMLIYGAIPVITAFMSFFPEVGRFLFSWLEPVQKSLP